MLVSKINKKPEIFYTFQGEGINTGKPVIFVRFATCNLHCSWCDTAYTWNWKGTPWEHDKKKKYVLQDQSVQMGAEHLASAMAVMAEENKCHRFTITGGEPLLQQAGFLETMEILTAIQKDFPERFPTQFQYDFETNGTIMPKEELYKDPQVYFNVSPKLEHSGNAKEMRYKPDVLKLFASDPTKASFKFVVDKPSDVEEIKEIQADCSIPSSSIYLMPQGITKKAIQIGETNLAEVCKDNGYNLTTRLHVLVYGGAKRGV